MKLRVRVDYNTYSALREVEREYREVLEDAVNYGLANRVSSSLGLKRGGFIGLRGRGMGGTCHPTISTLPARMPVRG